MIKISTLSILLACALTHAQMSFTSFEEPPVFPSEYIDTGDATMPHDLLNNANEPMVDYTITNGELGFNARYEPYDTPGSGLTDGDLVGVTAVPPNSTAPFPEGNQGYEISDVDGNFILEFDSVIVNSPTISIDYFISETGYEGDGTVNTSGSDRLRIYAKDLSNNMEYDLLNTTGNDINDLGIEGVWNTASVFIENSPNINLHLIIEVRTNSGAEAIFFDNVVITGLLANPNFNLNDFTLYPNPTSQDFVTIISNTAGVKDVGVFDVLGKQVINTALTSSRLDIADLTAGIYFIKIVQGNAAATKKLIVK